MIFPRGCHLVIIEMDDERFIGTKRVEGKSVGEKSHEEGCWRLLRFPRGCYFDIVDERGGQQGDESEGVAQRRMQRKQCGPAECQLVFLRPRGTG